MELLATIFTAMKKIKKSVVDNSMRSQLHPHVGFKTMLRSDAARCCLCTLHRGLSLTLLLVLGGGISHHAHAKVGDSTQKTPSQFESFYSELASDSGVQGLNIQEDALEVTPRRAAGNGSNLVRLGKNAATQNTANVKLGERPLSQAAKLARVKPEILRIKKASQEFQRLLDKPAKANSKHVRKLIKGGADGKLDVNEQEVVLAYLDTTSKSKASDPEDYNFLALKNDALEELIEQDTLHPQLGWSMLATISDESEDPVWREYVLQYMTFYYPKRWPTASRVATEWDPAEKKAVQRVLAACLFEDDGGLAGTAFNVLEELSEADPDFPAELLNRAALRILLPNSKASNTSKVTAFSYLARQNHPRFQSIAERILDDADASELLKVMARAQLAQG